MFKEMRTYDDKAITNKQAKLATRNKRAKVKRNLLLLVAEVGLRKILKDWWSSSGPEERLECLDYFKHEIEEYYLSFNASWLNKNPKSHTNI